MVVQVPNQPRIDLTEHKLFTLRQQRRSLFNQSERNLIDAIFSKVHTPWEKKLMESRDNLGLYTRPSKEDYLSYDYGTVLRRLSNGRVVSFEGFKYPETLNDFLLECCALTVTGEVFTCPRCGKITSFLELYEGNCECRAVDHNKKYVLGKLNEASLPEQRIPEGHIPWENWTRDFKGDIKEVVQ